MFRCSLSSPGSTLSAWSSGRAVVNSGLGVVPSGAGMPGRTASPLTEPVMHLAAKFRTTPKPFLVCGDYRVRQRLKRSSLARICFRLFCPMRAQGRVVVLVWARFGRTSPPPLHHRRSAVYTLPVPRVMLRIASTRFFRRENVSRGNSTVLKRNPHISHLRRRSTVPSSCGLLCVTSDLFWHFGQALMRPARAASSADPRSSRKHSASVSGSRPGLCRAFGRMRSARALRPSDAFHRT